MPAGDEPAQEGVAEKHSPYTVLLSRQARQNLSENLPLDVAIAATETIQHAIAVNPARGEQAARRAV
jgi:mRNA interferase RelE/StbE